jgi:hypothetical protein
MNISIFGWLIGLLLVPGTEQAESDCYIKGAGIAEGKIASRDPIM